MSQNGSVLIIGAGIAGMKAALMLAGASRKVHLVERLPIIGGKVIKNEESFPNMECSTCMVAPVQQAVLQNPDIETYTYSTVDRIDGGPGCFSAVIRKKARYISLVDCIGCGMCFDPCPVSLANEWEEGLMPRKAVYVPCSGSLPNVPVIDASSCLHLSGKQECSLCAESCAFEAVNLDDSDQVIEIEVGSVIIATGADTFDLSALPNLGYGILPSVYSPFEFERLFASNGPTQGEITLRGSGTVPRRIAIVHCVGRTEAGYCSSVCCMYSFKFVRFLRHKLPEAEVFNIHLDVCTPGKSYQSFFTSLDDRDTTMLFTPSIDDVRVTENGPSLTLSYPAPDGNTREIEVDMVILAAAMVPDRGLGEIAQMAGIQLDRHGFVMTVDRESGSLQTSRDGIFVAGTAEGPKDIQNTVIQAESAAGQALEAMSAAAAVNKERASGS
ncbi:MAG: CoB--CoM heterodisulfide reductase iron-sulfur subunit A family protein [Candidatus Fermentibacteraceae bacterium]|nr:CoB--CoM heterodisulfide reductase iron-sulfur subunit A family protein [Candidatus Fermentibacteraceae bacterium]